MKEQNDSHFEEDFKELGDDLTMSFSKSKENQPLAHIRPRFKIPKKQSSEGGLSFSIIIVNNSQEDQTISNPLDSIEILIQDEEGWPVKLPAGAPPRILINTRGDFPIDIVRPFEVEAIENSMQEPGLMEHLKEEKFLLKKSTSYEFKLTIPKVQDSNKKDIQASTLKTKTLEKGKYKIKILFQLLLSNDSPIHRQVESDFMNIELD